MSDKREMVEPAQEQPAEERLSRRDLMRLGLATLAGMGISAVAAPASAWAAGGDKPSGGVSVQAAGGNFILGGNATTNNADAADTYVTSATTGYTLRVYNTGSAGSGLCVNQETASPWQAAYIGTVGGGGAALWLTSQGAGSPATGSHLKFTSSIAGAPTTGAHTAGELFVDSAGLYWRCVSAGTPGTWVRASNTVVLGTPKRVIDTRNGTGGISGRLVKRRIYTFNSFLTTAGIPANAAAIIGNLTMVAPDGLEPGAWMAIVPATYANGTTMPGGYPGVSTINSGFTDAIANQYTCALGVGTYAGKVSIMWDGVSDVQPYAIVDVTGYII